MKKISILIVIIICTSTINAQVAINTDGSAVNTSAMLDVVSTDKGMLVPRMTTAQRTVIAAPATGLLVFDTNTNGFWFHNGTSWSNLSRASLSDTDGDTYIDTEKNPDNDSIVFYTMGMKRMV